MSTSERLRDVEDMRAQVDRAREYLNDGLIGGVQAELAALGLRLRWLAEELRDE